MIAQPSTAYADDGELGHGGGQGQGLDDDSIAAPEVSMDSTLLDESATLSLTHSNACVSWVGISAAHTIVCFSSDDLHLTSYSVNGVLLARCYVREDLKAFCLSTDGRTIITGGAFGIVCIRWVHSLFVANDCERKGLDSILDGALYKDGSSDKDKDKDKDKERDCFSAPIRSLHLSSDEFFLFVGLDNGEVRILSQDSMYLRKRLDSKLRAIGI
jgi:hypothetical protein